jgi:hypothetical protein
MLVAHYNIARTWCREPFASIKSGDNRDDPPLELKFVSVFSPSVGRPALTILMADSLSSQRMVGAFYWCPSSARIERKYLAILAA